MPSNHLSTMESAGKRSYLLTYGDFRGGMFWFLGEQHHSAGPVHYGVWTLNILNFSSSLMAIFWQRPFVFMPSKRQHWGALLRAWNQTGFGFKSWFCLLVAVWLGKDTQPPNLRNLMCKTEPDVGNGRLIGGAESQPGIWQALLK